MSYTAFAAQSRVASGSLVEVVTALKALSPERATLVFDDSTGHCVELDLRGTLAEALARLPADATPPAKAGPGRPKLGVVPREVTLLPRHWDWLASQPGGASVALRKLVEAASRANRACDAARLALEACHNFLATMAGNLPGFEDATRALFAGNFNAVPAFMQDWPADIRAHARHLLHEAQNAAYEARED
ncbi:DUF2239 family protein [Viridibacterium curvum]|uniref:DUF2239 family protein n=1 Tax=Viridibacterium curvum TaxID=1101404 RepID=A0ABP9QS88_9RHOO